MHILNPSKDIFFKAHDSMDHTASNIHTFEQVGLNFFSIIIFFIINITTIITIIIITVVDSCTNVMIITC